MNNYLILRSLRKQNKILGLSFSEIVVIAAVFSVLSLFMQRYMIPVMLITTILYLFLFFFNRNKPDGYLIDRLIFILDKGVWIKSRDKMKNT